MYFVLVLLTCNKLTLGYVSGAKGSDEKIRCLERERRALLMFKEALVDDYGILSSWGSEEDKMDCCKWRGVRCSNQTGHVTELDLHVPLTMPEHHFHPVLSLYLPYLSVGASYPFLSGEVSPSLLELQHLRYLDLSGNSFEGNKIPEFIASFGRLQYLNLSSSGFSGPIPKQFGNISKLQYLDLGRNDYLDGGNLDWLSSLSLLRHLDLEFANLSKATNWVESINSLPLLETLYLRGCQLPEVNSHAHSFNSSLSLALLDLSMNDLSSTIYGMLLNLSSSLIDVDLHSNQLKGLIPDAFGNMISLVYLDLSENQLEGGIPKSFLNLSCLQWLELSSNHLSEDLPVFLQNLSGSEDSLEVLDLEGNQLSGKLPDFTRFSSLRKLYLPDNQLNGPFPQRFQKFSPLVALDLSRNQITGLLPDLTLFSSLVWLDLGENKLEGIVPKSIGQLSKLKYLDFSSNSFEGIIFEAHFSHLSSLQHLDLSFNQLLFNFSSVWIPPFQLDVIRLSSCKLGHHFPEWLRHQNKFYELDMSGAGILDSVPSWFWDQSPNLRYLNLSNNQIIGSLPDLSLKFSGLPTIDLSSNRFTGQIPLVPSNSTFLNLSKNMFSGVIYFLCAITGFELSYLDLSMNQLSGGLPDCWENWKMLRVLSLANNSLSGKLPTSMGFLYQLEVLQLRDNNFSGELPSSLKKCLDLRIIDLGRNRFRGKIVKWIGTHLSKLIVLTLRSNEFYGSIPQSICHLSFIQILDLSQNDLSGKLPHCFNNFSALVRSNSSEATTAISYLKYMNGTFSNYGVYKGNTLVQWKGQEREYEKTLGLLKSIDLSRNKLTGNIPQSLVSLAGLVSLNLSRNYLTGEIVPEIGEMKMLESLDLSGNKLSGEIPTSLAQLNYLSVLNLSNNDLWGRIPSSTQLQSFDASAYSRNTELCGLPLPNKCPGEKTGVDPAVTSHDRDKRIQDDEEDPFITPGFYVSMGLGFAFGFWAIFGTLLFHSPLRYAYFKFWTT